MNLYVKPSFHVQLQVTENGYPIQLFNTDIQGNFVKTFYNSVKRQEVKEVTQECNKRE